MILAALSHSPRAASAPFCCFLSSLLSKSSCFRLKTSSLRSCALLFQFSSCCLNLTAKSSACCRPLFPTGLLFITASATPSLALLRRSAKDKHLKNKRNKQTFSLVCVYTQTCVLNEIKKVQTLLVRLAVMLDS